MSPTFDAFVRSWPREPWLDALLLASALFYARGWRLLRRRDPWRWHAGRLAAFWAALVALFLALSSPIEPFAGLLLQVHMVQHLLLVMVAAPLAWLGAPLLPLLYGLPRPIRTTWIAPLLRARPLRTLCARLAHPLVAGPLFVAATWFWHVPRWYELALSSGAWHVTEHACFLATALAFWFPVVRPHPSRPRWSPWIIFPYLILADLQNTLLAAWLTFADQPLYPHYAAVPRLGGLSALDDQAIAGAIMWVPGSIAFLLPLAVLAVRALAAPATRRANSRNRNGTSQQRQRGLPIDSPMPALRASAPREIFQIAKPQSSARPWDLLEVPLVGRFLRWHRARPMLQVLLLLLAIAMVYDGLRGPPAGPMNLAGVLPWIHWRGLVVLALLVGGNFFCMACPFTLPRAAARRWLPGGWAWPRALRGKWLAVLLVVLFLWSYEVFALWDNPWLTAWIALAYFATALLVDGLFSGAAFCKYVCPIGQFNFVHSLVSPLEVKVRDRQICADCQGKECIRGSASSAGCQMQLFQPRKAGNLDCTFCLDCVHACPHANLGLLAVVPGESLWTRRFRSGIGWLDRRGDLAVLVVVLVFGAFANAGGMIAPVAELLDRLRLQLGGASRWFVVSAYYAALLGAAPLLLVAAAACASRRLGGLRDRPTLVATRYVYALLPVGFAMWFAHYIFHFVTSYGTAIPVTQRFVADLGWQGLGEPAWQQACCAVVPDWVPCFEILILDFGLLLSLYTAYRIAGSERTDGPRAMRACWPWCLLSMLLFAVGVWIVLQPMQMRGTLEAGV